jgi:WD40 repeat protein
VFAFDLLDIGASACLSPDGQYVIVIGRSGKAVVGNTTTGEVFGLNEVTGYHPGMSIQPKYGIGWTTDDQLVFIAENEDSKHLFGFDVRTGESFHVAALDGPDWKLSAGWSI